MPRFFFNIAGAGVTDQEGEEFSSDRAARKEAVESAREILSEGVRAGWNMAGWKMMVTDEGGRTVVEVPISLSPPYQP